MARVDQAAWIRHTLRDGASLRLQLSAQAEAIAACARLALDSLRAGGKVLLFGNGGSAADAQHIAAELVGRLTVDRRALPAIALTTDSSALTAIANDYGFEQVFERQLRALGRSGDVAFAITTSGKSESILRAVRAARELGIRVVGLTGAGGREFAALCDCAVLVPTRETARIQELHITVGHMVCAIVEAELCEIAPPPISARSETKALTLEELLPLRESYRKQGRTVVWTNGCFDLLHAGHVASLVGARRLGDVLVVGVNDDAQVRRAKGPQRPIYELAQRVAILSALEAVDHVLAFSEATPVEVLRRLQPDVHCKGAHYANPGGEEIPEAAVVRAYGGRIEYLPIVEGVSTTSVAERIARGESR